MKTALPLLVLATRNIHKTREIAEMLADMFEVRDLGSYPQAPLVDETGNTFLDNATLKAVSGSKVIDGIILADDSGLEVDALDGKPGVHSSSFGGEEGNHDKNNAKMLVELAKVKSKDPENPLLARFHCCMVIAEAGKVLAHFDGSVEGSMCLEKRGSGGFGYDPLFKPRGFSRSFAELAPDEKHTLSHRGRALAQVITYLKNKAQG